MISVCGKSLPQVASRRVIAARSSSINGTGGDCTGAETRAGGVTDVTAGKSTLSLSAEAFVMRSGATVGAGSGVLADVPAGKTVLGYPAADAREKLKEWVACRNLIK